MDPDRIGRFRVERLLGSGSFATVYLAHDEDLDSTVAIKILAENWSRDEDAKRRFLSEARALRALDSDRIVRVYDIGQTDDGRPYMVTEHADRGSLAERMQARRASGGRYEIEEAVSISIEIAECLIAAHDKRIIHRDLKPSNVLFRAILSDDQAAMAREGKTVRAERMLLADFGIARKLEEAGGTRTMVVGTPHYMAPEQADPESAQVTDERADVYAAAVVLYELLSGAVPYPYDSIVSVVRAQQTSGPPPIRNARPEVSEVVASVLSQGLATDPAARYPSARAWRDALRAATGAGTAPPRVAAPTTTGAPTGSETVTDATPHLAQPVASERRRQPSKPRRTASDVPVPAAAGAKPTVEPPPYKGERPPSKAAAVAKAAGGRGVRALVVVLLMGLLGGAGIGVFASRSASASEVTLEPSTSVGPDPFDVPPETKPQPSGRPAPTQTPKPDTPPRSSTKIAGKDVPLYGGTGEIGVCDKDRLVEFLKTNVEKAKAWAKVQGIDVAQIPAYVQSMKRLIVNIDMRVTNHGFKNGLATARQSLLQKGTALLVDALGIPRVRCKCGNPLLPPKKTSSKPKYVGAKWKGFNPGVVVAAPALPKGSATPPLPTANPTRTISVQDAGINPEGTYSGFLRAVSGCFIESGQSFPFNVEVSVDGTRLNLAFRAGDSGPPVTVTLTLFENLSFSGRYNVSGGSGTMSGRFAGNRIVDGQGREDNGCVFAWSATKTA